MNGGGNIHPVFDRMLGREVKEARLGQRGLVIWLYGLSGSGKSTIAIALERRLAAEGFFTQILDGDNIRSGLNRNLGFSDEDRSENIRRVAEVAKLFAQAGVVTLTSFITPRRDLRELARQIIGPADFREVYVEASFKTCASRDPKGLYAKAAGGGVNQFTGQDSAFEEPESPDLLVPTERLSVDEAVELLHRNVIDRIQAD
ncbi:MAG: adenylylsulfate kinase [Verrucomicrobia bacterium]|nr:MAG: adenylylsulfate kinase [Verrucomicrobiota bacterium]